MSRTVEALQGRIGGCRLTAEQERCNFSSYFGVNNFPLKVWPPPRDAGPLHYGRRNPGCQDCRGCNSRQWICSENVMIIFLGIEFAKDHTLQIPPYNTTQDSIILGHLKDMQAVALVVFNTGLHDLAIASHSVTSDGLLFYEKNLRYYSTLLSTSVISNKIVWLSISSVVESKILPKYKKITNNLNIKLYNQVAERIMRENGIDVLDTFYLSQKLIYQHLNIDGVHWGNADQKYYKDLALIVLCIAFSEPNVMFKACYRNDTSV